MDLYQEEGLYKHLKVHHSTW